MSTLERTALGVAWQGPDADRFRDRMIAAANDGRAAAGAVRDRAGELAREADEQDAASAADEAGLLGAVAGALSASPGSAAQSGIGSLFGGPVNGWTPGVWERLERLRPGGGDPGTQESVWDAMTAPARTLATVASAGTTSLLIGLGKGRLVDRLMRTPQSSGNTSEGRAAVSCPGSARSRRRQGRQPIWSTSQTAWETAIPVLRPVSRCARA